MLNIVASGSSGAIGSAFIAELAQKYSNARINGLSRTRSEFLDARARILRVDYLDETSLQRAAEYVEQYGAIDLIAAAGRVLHQTDMMPEKSLRGLSASKLMKLYFAKAVGPALIAKHFFSLLPQDRRAVFAALSALLGSISDNSVGGWYSYRASKAALNMLIRSASIEMGRRNRQAVVVGLRPGTVDSALTRPFQRNVALEKLFSPQYAVSRMPKVLDRPTTLTADIVLLGTETELNPDRKRAD